MAVGPVPRDGLSRHRGPHGGRVVDLAAPERAGDAARGLPRGQRGDEVRRGGRDRKSTRLNSSHLVISYAVFCLKKKKKQHRPVQVSDQKLYGKTSPRSEHMMIVAQSRSASELFFF